MSGCDRFEREGLLRIEQGLPLAGDGGDRHFATCPDCRAAQEVYDRLRAQLAALDAEAEPPPGWQEEVRRRIAERRLARPAVGRPWFLAAGLAAAALVGLWLSRAPGPEAAAVALRVAVERGATTHRGDDARPGDRLALAAQTGAAAAAELRVYRNDRELLLRCSTEPPCARAGSTLTAALELDAAGSYQPVLLLGPAPPPAAGLDRDAAAAVAAGAEVELGAAIVVR